LSEESFEALLNKKQDNWVAVEKFVGVEVEFPVEAAAVRGGFMSRFAGQAPDHEIYAYALEDAPT
jgi:hypothetical protein